MTQEALDPVDSAAIFEALAAVSPGVDFAIEQAPADDEAPAAAADVQPFVFGQDGPRPAERLSGLERMGEKIARAMRPAIEPIARARVSVTCEPLELRTFQEWQNEQPDFSALTLYRLRPLKGGMLVQIDANFIASLVEIFYGGAPGANVKRKPGDFTASEELLLNRLLE